MHKNAAIIFTTDKGYLVPTLLVAEQIALQNDVFAVADILIFLTDFTLEEFTEIEGLFADRPFKFVALDAELYALPMEATFNKTHVPRSALARLATGNLIPENYDFIIYIDGDVQIVGSLLPLVTKEPVEGQLLAACDQAYISWPEKGRYASEIRKYLHRLGIEDPFDYFNSGVLVATRSTWLKITVDALEFMRNHSRDCRYHDQSALNAVARDRRVHLSPKYNCVSWYHLLGLVEEIEPAIIHFTGGAKPWNTDTPPWNGRFRHLYSDFVSKYPLVRKYWNPQECPDQGLSLGWMIPWRRWLRRRRAKRYLEREFIV